MERGSRGVDSTVQQKRGGPYRVSDSMARQIAVKTKYKLWITQAEKDAIGRVLATCPGQKLPEPGAAIPVTVTRTLPAPSANSGRSTPSGGGRSGAGQVYANCTAARAAGVTPILRGTPDYAAQISTATTTASPASLRPAGAHSPSPAARVGDPRSLAGRPATPGTGVIRRLRGYVASRRVPLAPVAVSESPQN